MIARIIVISNILILLGSQVSLADPTLINVKNYIGYAGYLLKAMTYAKKLHPSLAVPNLSEIKVGYSLLRDAYSFFGGGGGTAPSEENIVRTPIEKVSDVGLIAINSGTVLLGYAVKDTSPTLAWILYGGQVAKGYIPSVVERFAGSALPGLNGSYNLDEFTGDNKQETYLSCSYTDPKNSANTFKTWAYEKYIDNETSEKLKFYSSTPFTDKSVLLSGRWISYKDKGSSGYVFGTIADPLLLKAACIEAISAYAKEKGLEISNFENIGISAGNTVLSNSYPIRFFVPMIMKAPTWQKIKPVIIKKALLLMDKSGT